MNVQKRNAYLLIFGAPVILVAWYIWNMEPTPLAPMAPMRGLATLAEADTLEVGGIFYDDQKDAYVLLKGKVADAETITQVKASLSGYTYKSNNTSHLHATTINTRLNVLLCASKGEQQLGCMRLWGSVYLLFSDDIVYREATNGTSGELTVDVLYELLKDHPGMSVEPVNRNLWGGSLETFDQLRREMN